MVANVKESTFPKVEIFSAVLFLFFIQQITFLVEAIYMLNLLNTKMDIRVLGISFLFLPGLLFQLKNNKPTYLLLVLTMAVCMFLSPLLPTPWRIFSAGIGAGLFLTYLGLQLSDHSFLKVRWGQSAALATLTMILFRVIGHTQDISITGETKYIGWVFIAITLFIFFKIINGYPYKAELPNHDDIDKKEWIGQWLSIRGIAASIIFIYFVLSSPVVLARWTDTNYALIHILLVICIWLVVFMIGSNTIHSKQNKLPLIIWNTLFLIVFVWNILLHRVSFPTLENIVPVVVEDNGIIQAAINYLMLLLSPIVFINIGLFTHSVKPGKPSNVALPFLRAAGLLIVCVFILIFTNTWGYVGAVSRIFRNQFALPFALAGFFFILPYLFGKLNLSAMTHNSMSSPWLKTIAGMLVISCCGFLWLYNGENMHFKGSGSTKLALLTYNIQQGVDLYGNKNFKGQLSKIKEINPDIICLQESDAARISGGNSDVVRYFQEKLGYDAYYGPKTVTGTYGTAILSRFPLENSRTVFTYSSKDEIGMAFSEVSIGGRRILIINSHPAGNKKSREEHINMVIDEAAKYDHVIAMGDYNFTQDSPYYQKIAQELNDSWLSLYPDAIGSMNEKLLNLNIEERKTSSGNLLGNGKIDMRLRIDHIFLSNSFEVLEAHYLPAPESETDHPLYWAAVEFKD